MRTLTFIPHIDWSGSIFADHGIGFGTGYRQGILGIFDDHFFTECIHKMFGAP